MTLEPGRVLSHYRLVEEIGKGGMGVVWKAIDTRLERPVAVKVLSEAYARDSQRLQWFQREAKAIATLNHPNIVTIHSVEEAEGARFLVMELVEGVNLSRRIPQEGMDLDTFFAVATGLADALSAAHEKGIVHRDIKPANIMVGAEERTKILDFGLAKLTEREGGSGLHEPSGSSKEADVTKDIVIGTTPYMSPERLRGEVVDARSDIFSLGIVLYEMVTGRLPFDGKTVADVASSLLKDDPTPPAEIRPDLPRHLSRIILRCLEKEPRERYQTALDVRNELRGLRRELDSQAVAVVEATGPIATPSRPRRGWIVAGVAVAALLIVGTVLVLRWDSGTSSQAGRGAAGFDDDRTMIVVLPFENLGEPGDQFFADGMTQEITSRLASIGELGVISRKSAARYATERPTVQQIGEELGVDYVLGGTVRWARDPGGGSRVRVTPELIRVADDTNLWSETYDRTIDDVLEIQSDIADNVIRQLGIELLHTERARHRRPGTTENMEAYSAFVRGLEAADRPGFRIENYQLATEMFERAVELDPDFALAHARLSDAHSNVYILGADRSEARASAARRHAERALELDPRLPEGYLAMGFYHYRVHRDYERALTEFEIAARDLPNDTELLLGMSFVLRRQGRLQDALAYQMRAGQLDPLSSQLARRLAVTYLTLGQDEDAIRAAERAIALAPDDATAYWVKAQAQLRRGEPQQAVATMKEIVAAGDWLEQYWLGVSEYFAGDYPTALERFSSLRVDLVVHQFRYAPRELLRAEVLDVMGDADAARAAYLSALRVLETEFADHLTDSRLHADLGLTYAGLGNADQAIDHGRRSVELLPISKDAVDGPDRVFKLALIYARLGRVDEALGQVEVLLQNAPGLSLFSVPLLELDPRFDAVREHPRYRELVDRASG